MPCAPATGPLDETAPVVRTTVVAAGDADADTAAVATSSSSRWRRTMRIGVDNVGGTDGRGGGGGATPAETASADDTSTLLLVPPSTLPLSWVGTPATADGAAAAVAATSAPAAVAALFSPPAPLLALAGISALSATGRCGGGDSWLPSTMAARMSTSRLPRRSHDGSSSVRSTQNGEEER